MAESNSFPCHPPAFLIPQACFFAVAPPSNIRTAEAIAAFKDSTSPAHRNPDVGIRKVCDFRSQAIALISYKKGARLPVILLVICPFSLQVRRIGTDFPVFSDSGSLLPGPECNKTASGRQTPS